ncbi:hypothetical protein [Lentzea aerocolonigenes]|uniref:hypothetical protein n=1 Tax=Lentzea aerocolonigenes TaxID=68170 RepID=UPI0012E1F935|nr:hypothetical protein [Lentzea aerocolonigenes]
MADLFIVGHGRLLGSEVYVPAGQRVHFYAHKHTALPLGLGLAALSTAGGTGPVWSAGTARHSVRCRNVAINAMADVERLVFESVVASGTAIFAGDPEVPLPPDGLALCEAPSACRAARAHTCGGWLDVLAGRASDLHFVTCLLDDEDEASARTRHTGEEEARRHRGWRKLVPDALRPGGRHATGPLVTELEETAARFAKLSYADKERTFDSWSNDTKALMRTQRVVEEWTAIRGARTVLAEAGMFSLRAYLLAVSRVEAKICRTDPSVRHAEARANRWLDLWDHAGSARAEKAAAAWADLDAADRLGLTHTEPEMAARLARWITDFPDGMTPQRLAELVHEHNVGILRIAGDGSVLKGAVLGEIVALEPRRILALHDGNGFEVGTGPALRRHVRRATAATADLTVFDLVTGRTVVGAVDEPAAAYLRRLAAVVSAGVAEIQHADLTTLHHQHLLRGVNSGLLEALDRLNHALAHGDSPARHVLVVDDAIGARTKLAGELSQWSHAAYEDITTWWRHVVDFAIAPRDGEVLPQVTMSVLTAFLLTDGTAALAEHVDTLTTELWSAWADRDTARFEEVSQLWHEEVPGAVATVLAELADVPHLMAAAQRDAVTLAGRLQVMGV